MGMNTTATPQKPKKINEMAFTMDDVREVIKCQQEQKEQSEKSDIVELKQDILNHQPTNAGQQQKVKAASIADILGFNPQVNKQVENKDKDPSKVPAKYRKYYKMLLALKHKLQNGLDKLSPKNEAEDDPELENFDSGFALSLLSSEQEALTEIEQAIQRIHDGTYGICEATGNPIEPKRLEAVPFTRYSLQGQEAQEKQKIVKDQTNSSIIFDNEQHDDVDGFNNYEEE
ncbi:MAG: TraR/DksA family transcriptional regulator [Opitutales bacterium]|nr:TraR/DksA family transcriptional regulator [Opitutales bacterium]